MSSGYLEVVFTARHLAAPTYSANSKDAHLIKSREVIAITTAKISLLDVITRDKF